MVTLFLKIQKDMNDEAKVTAYSHLHDNLIKKYGQPVSVTEDTSIFRSSGQSIDVFAPLLNGLPTIVHIAYEATDTAKGI